MRITSEMELMLQGYGLTTAEILYRMPDHQTILQKFILQEYDLAPNFPRLYSFIGFWKAKLDGPLHSACFSHRKLIAPNEWRNVSGEIQLK